MSRYTVTFCSIKFEWYEPLVAWSVRNNREVLQLRRATWVERVWKSSGRNLGSIQAPSGTYDRSVREMHSLLQVFEQLLLTSIWDARQVGIRHGGVCTHGDSPGNSNQFSPFPLPPPSNLTSACSSIRKSSIIDYIFDKDICICSFVKRPRNQ